MIGQNFLAFAFGMILASSMLGGQIDARDEPNEVLGKDKEEAQRELQLKNMRRSAAQYSISPAEDRKRLFKFHETAIMRFSNPVFAAKDGAVYIWTDRGRPQAIMKLYTYDEEHFNHEFQSLSEGEIIAERDGKNVWTPTGPGITFREVPDAPKPAESAVDRLRQMKSLAGKFCASYTDDPKRDKPIELRLLIQPLYRFEVGDEAKLMDGALFAFAQGTAPRVFLLFEARKNGDSQHWHYAFAKLITGMVTASYGEKEVFSVEKYDFSRDPKKTFLWLPGQPIPKE